jgi:hypothetical protein
MSFDNIGEKFEYVRHGSSWKLLKENLKIVKELMSNQGHWGGIHAVYNLYNATNFVELRQFAEEVKMTVLWQNLFQPDYLDPFLHDTRVATAAAKEINKFYSLKISTNEEQQFFNHALEKYLSITEDKTKITDAFKQHIRQIETRYHPDQTGNFAKLWPELEHLCK